MRNLAKLKLNSLRWTLFFLLGLGIAVHRVTPLRAEGVETAPVELKALITQIESATNRRDLQRVMQFYSPDFTNSDGLTYSTLEAGLSQFWKEYKVVEYRTSLQSWQQQGDKIVAETVTKIQGTGESLGRKIKLTTSITSRQHFKDNKLIYQEILAENTQITTGEHPPQIKLNLPDQVRVGQQFDFDVIVEEPLGDDLLAGAVLNEKITSDRYLNPGILELDLLSGGGIFKRATAPQEPNSQWFSAIIVRGNGITLVTQRVNVTE
jgi:ketosteroid isomerase-like protein